MAQSVSRDSQVLQHYGVFYLKVGGFCGQNLLWNGQSNFSFLQLLAFFKGLQALSPEKHVHLYQK